MLLDYSFLVTVLKECQDKQPRSGYMGLDGLDDGTTFVNAISDIEKPISKWMPFEFVVLSSVWLLTLVCFSL
jgi:hypothetical protein